MSARRRTAALVANPILVGAVTVLVTSVAVFLAYNANKGLPFVPTFQLEVETPNAARLVTGNDVREGGFRIGQVTKMRSVRKRDGGVGAVLTLQLDKSVTPIPRDSTIMIRPRSTLGLKFVDLIRGRSTRALPQGATITATEDVVPPEIDDLFETFTEDTRANVRRNLGTFGPGLAGRGADLNRAIEAFGPLLRDVQPVMRTLSDPSTRLARFFRELQETATATVPVSEQLAHGFTAGADVFEALSEDPAALDQTIARSPRFLRVATPSLIAQRPFLRRLAGISDEVSGTARAIRQNVRPVNRALAAGTRVLPDTPPLFRDLAGAMNALRDLSRSPTTNLVLDGLTTTSTTLRSTLRWLGPHVTVCNYWNYWWTYLSDHLAEEVDTGTLQRIQTKGVSPFQPNTPSSFGASEPANGDENESFRGVAADPVRLHSQVYGRAVDEQGSADCETGQRGFPRRLAPPGVRPDLRIAVSPRTPGNQGPTFSGRQRVPEGQTFSAEPTGLAPRVNIP